jgi:uncharacterized protein YvpB
MTSGIDVVLITGFTAVACSLAYIYGQKASKDKREKFGHYWMKNQQ